MYGCFMTAALVCSEAWKHKGSSYLFGTASYKRPILLLWSLILAAFSCCVTYKLWDSLKTVVSIILRCKGRTEEQLLETVHGFVHCIKGKDLWGF